MNIAIIKTGGKQYLVKKDDKVKLEKLPLDAGKKITFETLLLSDDKGKKVELGTPSLGKKVEAKILQNSREKKVKVVKYKPKTRYKVTTGHRQAFSQVQITKI